MATCKSWLTAPVLVLTGWLLAAGPAVASVTAEVRDDGAFFSKEAVKKANDAIRQIHDDNKHDLLIETFKEIPEDVKKDYDEKNKSPFFEKWARERARDMRVNGIYVLICKNPSHLQVEVGNETRKKAFTLANRDKLAEVMVGDLKKKDNDKALLDAVEYVHKTMDENLGRTGGARQAEGNHPEVVRGQVGGDGPGWGAGLGGMLCIGLVVVLGIWLVFGLIRALTGMGRGGYGGGYGGGPGYGGGYGGGGGGFMSGLMGGLFGAVAGNWMYNNFLGGGHGGGWGSSSAYGAGSDPGAAGGTREDTDYSGTGGDFGDDAGGGGGGGGDFGDTGGGGGDFGGGDAGGGGGDFGGGGGDFGGGGGGDFGGGGGDFGGGGGGGGGDF